MDSFTLKKLHDFFGGDDVKFKVEELVSSGLIPPPERVRVGATYKKCWPYRDIPQIGEQIGFINFPKKTAISVFTTKGGVLKSTMALNLARVAALHNYRTVVIGLDMQGDVTRSLGLEDDDEEDVSLELEDALEKVSRVRGLPDFFNSQSRLTDLVRATDIPTLFYIPETPELVSLNESINTINRREYWLRDKVVTPLKEYFDLIIMDCSPNWNKLTTNSLVASDFLVSPLECKINNFRNFKVFNKFLNEFREEMDLALETIFVPTRYSKSRKLTMEIREWYQSNIAGCTTAGIRESVQGEEATALNLSFGEHSSSNKNSIEMRDLLREISAKIEGLSAWSDEKLYRNTTNHSQYTQ